MERFYEFKLDDDTARLNRWLLGMLEPGVYRGYDAGHGANPWDVIIVHDFAGIEQVLANGTTDVPKGILVTKQGCILQEGAQVTIPVTSAHGSLDRYDTLYVEHVYSGSVIGGTEHSYGVVTGTPNATPVKPVLADPSFQTIIGWVRVIGGSADLSDAIFTKPEIPNLGKKPNQSHSSSRGTLEVTADETGFLYDMLTMYGVGSLSTFNRTGLFIIEGAEALSYGLPEVLTAVITIGDGTTVDPAALPAIQIAKQLVATNPTTGEESLAFMRIRPVDSWGEWEEIGPKVINLGDFGVEDSPTDGDSYTLYDWFTNEPLLSYPSMGTPMKLVRRTGKYVCRVCTPTDLKFQKVWIEVATYKNGDKWLAKATLSTQGPSDGESYTYATAANAAINTASVTSTPLTASPFINLVFLNGASSAGSSPANVVRRGSDIRFSGKANLPAFWDPSQPFARFTTQAYIKPRAEESISGALVQNTMSPYQYPVSLKLVYSGVLCEIYVDNPYGVFIDTNNYLILAGVTVEQAPA